MSDIQDDARVAELMAKEDAARVGPQGSARCKAYQLARRHFPRPPVLADADDRNGRRRISRRPAPHFSTHTRRSRVVDRYIANNFHQFRVFTRARDAGGTAFFKGVVKCVNWNRTKSRPSMAA